MVQAAALDGIVQLAGAVAGQNRHRWAYSFDGADFRNADLVFTQVLEQKGFKWLVCAVNFVNQQHRAGCRRLQGLQQRAANQIAVLVDLSLNVGCVAIPAAGPPQGGGRPLGGQRGHASAERGGASTFSSAHVQQLSGVVPFVQRFALLQAVIALQANQLALQRDTQGFCQLGFADARFAFK